MILLELQFIRRGFGGFRASNCGRNEKIGFSARDTLLHNVFLLWRKTSVPYSYMRVRVCDSEFFCIVHCNKLCADED